MWARITHTWETGAETEFEVGTDTPAYPDAAAECVARVLDMYRTCIGVSDEDES